jgi:hypothetical protein
MTAESVTGRAVLHIIRERDVGLFSLVQQVVANVAWADHEGRLPIADFRERCCYWTPRGYAGAESVWEYYFEPLVDGFPAEAITDSVRAKVDESFPDQNDLGRFIDPKVFVTNHYGDHPSLATQAPAIPYALGSAPRALRTWTSQIMRDYVRPRSYLADKVDRFVTERFGEREVIGVHVRGTDSVSAEETRAYRQGSLDLDRYVAALARLLAQRPQALVFVATDAQASLECLTDAFGDRVIAYDTMRHLEGEAAGAGPTGCIMPAYITHDRDAAARNGEDAIVEYLLLGRCSHLVHNGAGLAMTVLLRDPSMPHTNTHGQAGRLLDAAPSRV